MKKIAKRKIVLIALCLSAMNLMASNARVVERAQADSMRATQVIYNGRVCPLNTPARDFLLKLTGKTTFQGLTPEQVMLSWALYPQDWKDVALIKVKNAAARQQLGIKGDHASFANFFDSKGNYKFQEGEYTDIEDKLTTVILLTRGELFAPPSGSIQPLPPSRINAELLYNAVPWDTILFATCFSMALLLFLLRLKKQENKVITYGSVAIKSLLTLFLILSFSIRWYISDHIPVSNTYETLLVIALTALVISCFTRQYDIPALIVAASTLLVAHLGALNPQVTPLVPILQSPWLSFHVTTIMISYSLFALLLFRPNRTMHIWAEILLGTGIILGSIWAKTAWGAYWSWDPKETWALITFIIYLFPLFTTLLPWFRHQTHQKWYLRLAFLTILWTYFGCNYLLTGMHSYK